MEPETHPDPIHDAARHAAQQAMQVLSIAAAAAQIVVRQFRIRDERNQRERRALIEQARQHRVTARARWAPAHDSRWLRDANLLDAARVWGAAVPYANRASRWFDSTAESAMHKCEDRLRTLHPHAMARYDRLRADGLSPTEAMRQSAPLFKRPPNVRDGTWSPRSSLLAGNGLGHSWADAEHGPSRAEWETHVTTDAQTRRARQILDESQEQARADGRGQLGETEQRLTLETATNLRPEIIDAAVRPDSPARPASHRPRKLWAQDFPLSIEEVLAAMATTGSGAQAAPPAQQPALRQAPHATPPSQPSRR